MRERYKWASFLWITRYRLQRHKVLMKSVWHALHKRSQSTAVVYELRSLYMPTPIDPCFRYSRPSSIQ